MTLAKWLENLFALLIKCWTILVPTNSNTQTYLYILTDPLTISVWLVSVSKRRYSLLYISSFATSSSDAILKFLWVICFVICHSLLHIHSHTHTPTLENNVHNNGFRVNIIFQWKPFRFIAFNQANCNKYQSRYLLYAHFKTENPH